MTQNNYSPIGMKHYNEPEELSNKIIDRISPDLKAPEYLAEALNLSKESVYRRLKGIIPFTFEEILLLSGKLDFSMDELLKGDKNEQVFFNLQNNTLVDVDESFLNIFRHYSRNIEEIYKSENSHVTITANRILAIFTCPYQNLFKFCYYRWLHQFGNNPLNYKLSDVQIPKELEELRKKTVQYSAIENLAFITDQNIVYNTVKDIKYFIDRHLIEQNEIALLKEELNTFIRGFQTLSETGIYGEGNHEVYLSSLNIEENTSYVVCDDKIYIELWPYSDTSIFTSDPQLCMLHKDWMDSLKKFSILVSNSNQKMQAELYELFTSQLEMLNL